MFAQRRKYVKRIGWPVTTQILEGSVLHFAAPAPPFQLFLGNSGGTFELPPMKMRIKFLSRLQWWEYSSSNRLIFGLSIIWSQWSLATSPPINPYKTLTGWCSRWFLQGKLSQGGLLKCIAGLQRVKGRVSLRYWIGMKTLLRCEKEEFEQMERPSWLSPIMVGEGRWLHWQHSRQFMETTRVIVVVFKLKVYKWRCQSIKNPPQPKASRKYTFQKCQMLPHLRRWLEAPRTTVLI